VLTLCRPIHLLYLYHFQGTLKVSQCVGVEVTEKHYVIIVLKSVSEGHGVLNAYLLFNLLFLTLALHHVEVPHGEVCGVGLIPEVLEIETSSVPALPRR
jgi:hypothetical protein